MRPSRLAAIAAALGLCIAGLIWMFSPTAELKEKSQLGLMTSLPIYWSESADLGGFLDEDEAPHWARTAFEQRYELVPLDSLASPDAARPSQQLNGLAQVALLQPRALSPADFAALDIWVNDGGNLLLLADPVLTEHSDFALGDQRRPQSIAMLSPILTRWGLTQYFDESQAAERRFVVFEGVELEVEQVGHFQLEGSGAASCELYAQGLVADCEIGKGKALIVADAALLDAEGGGETGEKAIEALAIRAFDSN